MASAPSLDRKKLFGYKAILNYLALFVRFDVLRSTPKGALIVCLGHASVLTQPTLTYPLRAACPHGPRVECRLDQARGPIPKHSDRAERAVTQHVKLDKHSASAGRACNRTQIIAGTRRAVNRRCPQWSPAGSEPWMEP